MHEHSAARVQLVVTGRPPAQARSRGKDHEDLPCTYFVAALIMRLRGADSRRDASLEPQD
jgi:hypothetical protein